MKHKAVRTDPQVSQRRYTFIQNTKEVQVQYIQKGQRHPFKLEGHYSVFYDLRPIPFGPS